MFKEYMQKRMKKEYELWKEKIHLGQTFYRYVSIQMKGIVFVLFCYCLVMTILCGYLASLSNANIVGLWIVIAVHWAVAISMTLFANMRISMAKGIGEVKVA